jgi:hypothetical protein
VSLEREVRGKSIQGYLKDNGATDDEVKQLWELRQVVHGKNVFSRGRVTQVTDLVGVLRKIVLDVLRVELCLPNDQPPQLLSAGGPSLAPGVALGGTSTVDETDVWLEQQQTTFALGQHIR